MAYIGTSPSNGVRRIHTYTATAGQTTFTGSSTEGVTLTYADTNYIDVFQNGVLLGSADYTSTSGTSVVLAQGASVSDLVVIVVYDVFSVADTVSKTAGGSFDSAVTMSSTLAVTGETTLATHLNMGDNDKIKLGDNADLRLYHDGSNSYIEDLGTGDLRVQTNGANFLLENTDGDDMIKAISDGAVEIYNNSTKRFETQSDGCKTHGVHRIAADASNAYALSVVNDGNNPNRYGISIQCGEDTPSTVNYLLGFQDGNGNAVGSITFNNAGQTQFNASSDYRLKENVTEDWDATTRLKELKPCRFNFKKYPNITLDGFIAHEAQEVVPEAVVGEKDAVDDNGNPMYQGIDQSKLVPLLVKTILELEARITALESK